MYKVRYLAMLVVILLQACGQIGPLYLPTDPPPSSEKQK